MASRVCGSGKHAMTKQVLIIYLLSFTLFFFFFYLFCFSLIAFIRFLVSLVPTFVSLLFLFLSTLFSQHVEVLLKILSYYNATHIFLFLWMVAENTGGIQSLCLPEHHMARNQNFFIKETNLRIAALVLVFENHFLRLFPKSLKFLKLGKLVTVFKL